MFKRSHWRTTVHALLYATTAATALANTSEMQRISHFEIDRTEVTIGQFRAFANATGVVTRAERDGGGSTYEGGWQQRRGWTWATPFGKPADADEPAVHITYSEAKAYCEWAGKRLPTDAEWGEAAYVERRANAPTGFVTGRRYPYPTGESPRGANCLGDCGKVKTVPTADTSRGDGHARVGTTISGVNGLFDMGGNVWEWVDSGAGHEKRTRGGSWWYGAEPMRDTHRQTKPQDTAVVYIGFRCAKDVKR